MGISTIHTYHVFVVWLVSLVCVYLGINMQQSDEFGTGFFRDIVRLDLSPSAQGPDVFLVCAY